MTLTPREVDKLGLHNASRGLRLNYTESVASQILEIVRDGDNSVAELMDIGKRILGRRQVLWAVPHLLDTVRIEGTFPEGTKLIIVHDVIASEDGNLELALHTSFLPVPALDKFSALTDDIVPGHTICGDGDIVISRGRAAVILRVTNTGDRPVRLEAILKPIPSWSLTGGKLLECG